jgi:hypothetical protein
MEFNLKQKEKRKRKKKLNRPGAVILIAIRKRTHRKNEKLNSKRTALFPPIRLICMNSQI